MASGSCEPGAATNAFLPFSSFAHGMQSFSTATLSQLISQPASKNIRDCSEVYSLQNPQPISSHALVQESADDQNTLHTKSISSTVLSNAAQQLRQQTSYLNSFSAASMDSHSELKPRNPNGLWMGFEVPSNHFQTRAETSPQQETSASLEDEVKDERAEGAKYGETVIVSRSSGCDRGKNTDSKVLRRLAQNREAARKSRLRKKAYVQQLETSRVRLNQMEQELDQIRQQGLCVGGYSSGGDLGKTANTGVAAFNMDYARWVEEQNHELSELRSALISDMSDSDLHTLVDRSVAHYDELFRLKDIAVRGDVFHIVSGMWKTPAERCFMWMGGFRPSELLKILIPQLEPLTEQQLLAVCNLQQSLLQAEDALSQGMDALQQNLADTLSASSLQTPNVANYMCQMGMAMGRLGTLETFIRQADNLRQQTFHQMHQILTTRQAARGLLAMGNYFSWLRALSSLWIARPQD